MTLLRVQQLDPGLQPLAPPRPGDAGIDLRARVSVTLSASTGPARIPTGVAVQIPQDHVGYICPRSGLAADHGIGVLNAPGVIDPGYRGELMVILYSVQAEAFSLNRGARIAQLIVHRRADLDLVHLDSLAPSERGARGLGSSGLE
jgi:dUTP pyrophosphatase